MMNKKYLLFLIIFISFVLRFVGINWQLPYLYQTEEYKTVNYTLKMAATKSLNPKFFEYPSLYMYFMFFVYGLLFIGGKILGFYSSAEDFAIKFFNDPTVVYIVGRFFSALFGSLVVVATYFLGKMLYNKRVGVISAVMLGFLPIWIVYSHFIKPEMFSNLLVVLFAIFLYKYFLTDDNKFFYISCVLLGLATSSRYLSLPAGIMIFIVLVYKDRKFFLKNTFWVGVVVIILSFLIGTPYSLIDYKTFVKDIIGIIKGPELGLKRNILRGVLTTIHNYLYMGNKTIVIGLICFLGTIYSLCKPTVKKSMLLSVVFIFFVINSTHYFPAWGFLFTAFPFYIVLGAKFVDEITNKTRFAVYGFCFLMLVPLYESISVDISFCLKDTRTQALEWIEKNIPYREKILIDRYPNSPPLRMTKSQLEKLYKKAVELSHYKKEYFYWQLKAHPGENYGYEVYEVYHPPHEIGTIKHQVEEAQKVRELVDVSVGIEGVKKLGIKYFVYNSYSAETTTEPQIKNFYQEVENKAKLITEFKPKTKFHPGPVIRIYEL